MFDNSKNFQSYLVVPNDTLKMKCVKASFVVRGIMTVFITTFCW